MYKGYEEASGRVVLLKVLTLEAASDPVLVDWFEHEAEHVASVDHPNVVTLHRAGRDEDGRPYLVTEYIEGASLDEVLAQNGPLPPELVAHVGAEIAAGLAAAHRAGILHRDLKPANVLLGADGTVKLADFGLATRLDTGSDGSPAEVRGTPGYLAPETVIGKEAGPSADLFALGATLVEALIGQKAFPAADVFEALDSALNYDPVPRLKADPRIPLRLTSTIETLLHADADARKTADETSMDLRESAILPGRAGGEISSEILAKFLQNRAAYQALRPVSVAAPQTRAINDGADMRAVRPALWVHSRVGRAVAASLAVGLIAVAVLVVSGLRPDLQETGTIFGSDRADSIVVDFPERPTDSPTRERAPDTSASAEVERPRTEEDLRIDTTEPQATDEPEENGDSDDVGQASLALPAVENQATAQPGRLAVAVQPWAEVYVDGRSMGEGSLINIEQLTAGSHRILLRNPEFPDISEVIQIGPGSDERMAVSLWEYVARITLQVYPWANVELDGEPIGEVPPERTVIMRPGSHSIRLTHPDLGTWLGTVRVTAGERRTLPYNLNRLLGQPDD